MQVFEVRQELGVSGAQLGVAIDQHGGHLVVGEPRLRAHDGLEEAGAGDPTLVVEQQLGRHAEPVDPGVERAEAIAQDLRKHGDHAVGEIDRVAALTGLGVEGAAGAHIGRNIGDTDQELPTLGAALAIDGVVEVARIGPVDGDQGELAEIRAPGLGGLRDLGTQVRDLGLDRRRPVDR